MAFRDTGELRRRFMPFAIRGTSQGLPVFWRKWTSASVAGRPKWVDRLSLKCLFAQRTVAEKTLNGTGSGHFSLQRDLPNGGVVQVNNAEVVEVNDLP
jgi:urease accessory protein UreE